MTEQSGNITLTEIMSELAQLRQKVTQQEAEIAHLKTAQLAAPAAPPLKSSRRRLLRQLFGGAVVTLTAGALAASQSQTAQAGLLINTDPRYNNIAVPQGTTITAFPSGTAPLIGLVATGDSTVDFSSGIPGATTGVFGKTANGIGIFGIASGTGTGVIANSTDGTGIFASSTNGAPLRLFPKASAPSAGTRQKGEIYVSSSSPAHLFFYDGTNWVQVV